MKIVLAAAFLFFSCAAVADYPDGPLASVACIAGKNSELARPVVSFRGPNGLTSGVLLANTSGLSYPLVLTSTDTLPPGAQLQTEFEVTIRVSPVGSCQTDAPDSVRLVSKAAATVRAKVIALNAGQGFALISWDEGLELPLGSKLAAWDASSELNMRDWVSQVSSQKLVFGDLVDADGAQLGIGTGLPTSGGRIAFAIGGIGPGSRGAPIFRLRDGAVVAMVTDDSSTFSKSSSFISMAEMFPWLKEQLDPKKTGAESAKSSDPIPRLTETGNGGGGAFGALSLVILAAGAAMRTRR